MTDSNNNSRDNNQKEGVTASEAGKTSRAQRIKKLERTPIEQKLARSGFKSEKEILVDIDTPSAMANEIDPDVNSDLPILNDDNEDVLGGFSINYNPKGEDEILKQQNAYPLINDGLSEKHKGFRWATWVVFIIAILLSLANTAQYFIIQHDGWCGARRTLAARNFLRYGHLNLQMGPLDTRGYHVKENGKPKFDKFYWHHPPLVSATLSAVYGLFGESEANGRLMSAAFYMIIFIFLWLSFRNHWGDTPTFYALAVLNLMPFVASYNNFINFELMVTMWLVISIYLFDNYLKNRRIRDALLLFFVMFLGAYADYPMFVWMFYLWLLGVIRCYFIDRSLKKFLFYYVLAVISIVVLVGAQISLWKAGNFSGLYSHRYQAHYSVFDTVFRTIKKWGFYYGFFGPVAYIFSGYYILDLIRRVRKHNLSRGDGYLVAIGLTGLTYAIGVKDGTWVHSFFIWYFSLFIGLSGGYGLYRFLMFLTSKGFRRVHLLGVGIIIFALLWALPIIHMKRANPIYSFTKSITRTDSYLKFDYDVDKQVLSHIVREISEPDDFILIDNGLPVARNEFLTNMDRQHKVTHGAKEFIKKAKNKKYTFYAVNVTRISSNFRQYLLEKYNFISYKSLFVFNLRDERFDNIGVRSQHFIDASDFQRYFISLTHGKFEIVDHPLMALDYAIKLNKHESIKYYRRMFSGKFKAKAHDLESAAALYNNQIDLDEKADLKSIYKWVDKPEKPTSFGEVEFLGSRVYRRLDGRSELLVAFRTAEYLQQNYKFFVDGIARQKDKKLRKAIGNTEDPGSTIIPMSMWKPGLIYTMRTPLNLDSGGPYDIKIRFKYKDPVVAFNPDLKHDKFEIRCRLWNKVTSKDMDNEMSEEAIRTLVDQINADPLSDKSLMQRARDVQLGKAFKQKDMDGKFNVFGCFAKPGKKKDHYQTSVLMMNLNPHPMGWSFEFWGQGFVKDIKKKKKTKKFNKTIKMYKKTEKQEPFQMFWVELDIPYNPDNRKIQLSAKTKTNTKLELVVKDNKKKRSKEKSLKVSTGNWGIERPFAFIESLLLDPNMK